MAMEGADLDEKNDGLPQGAIGGKFACAAVDEGAAGHHQVADLASHGRRHRVEIGPLRRAGLEDPGRPPAAVRGRQEQALEQQPIAIKAGAPLTADAGGRMPATGPIGLQGLDPLHLPDDLGHAQRRAPAVTETALNQHQPRRHHQGDLQACTINFACGRQRQLVIKNDEFRQGTLPLTPLFREQLSGIIQVEKRG